MAKAPAKTTPKAAQPKGQTLTLTTNFLDTSLAKPAKGMRCQEASPQSGQVYLACGKPAKYIVKNGDPMPYAMCTACAQHNVNNRRAGLVVDVGGPITLATIPASPSPAPSAPSRSEPVSQAPETRQGSRDAMVEAAEAAPVGPVPPLEKLDLIHKAGVPVEQAFIKLNIAIRQAMAEIKGHGDRAAHLVQIYSKLRTAQDILTVQIKDFSTVLDVVGSVLIPEAFEREQLQTLTTQEGDRMTVIMKLYASIPAEKREEAYKWLREHGHEDIIQETVNASSLSAFAKAELAEGRELPDDIFSIFTKPSATLTRKKKGK